jgi:hypothetical protein
MFEVEAHPNECLSYKAYRRHFRNNLDPYKKLDPLSLIGLTEANMIPTKTIARVNKLHEKIIEADRNQCDGMSADTVLICLPLILFPSAFAWGGFNIFFFGYKDVPAGEIVMLLLAIIFALPGFTLLCGVLQTMQALYQAEKSNMLQKKFHKFKF